MLPNLRGYIWALAQEVPSAFRRGTIAATALAYIILAGAYLLLGDKLSLSTVQLWTGALVLAIAEVLIIFPYRLWKANVTEINALKAIDYSGPDWRIRELFQHINPDGLMERGNYEKVGLDVLDKLSTMQLLAWGRRDRGRPLEMIDYQSWSRARFTYWFLADDHDEAEHVTFHSLLTVDETFRDLRVNKGTALRLWRK
jgi:hypothetical protein